MVQESKSVPGQFANAIRRADPRTRARANTTAPQANIEHGHEGEGELTGKLSELPARWAAEAANTGLPEVLMPGWPRNADGSERTDGPAPAGS